MTMLRPRLWTPPHDAAATGHLPALTTELTTRLQQIAQQHHHVKFASSLAVEDMVITDVIAREQLPIEVFTLNTGALNSETLSLLGAVRQHWGIRIAEYRPDEHAVNAYIATHGKLAFYDSVALRRECCHIRKIEPLGRALSQADAWITGQRREQSATRTALALAEQDQVHGMAKYNPLAEWLETEIWAYARQQQLPVNALYQQGYPSIGCEPCTRPVKAGEDIRAGRWWWESQDSKECGLHK
nr:phosphoadenylyl-sulfate reductase [Snodgrassella alvi]